MPNRLARETSPYLLQHKDNPVDWYPWGEEALARARGEDRPILLSIGYSACHWCHVMERESFEDPETATLMNELFVSIKLDREERPDLDAIYMEACQAMTGQGGWPLNVFLTPEQVPFFAGTYFPPDSRMGMPSWRSVLEAGAKAWDERREEIREGGKRVAERLRGGALLRPSEQPFDESALDDAVELLRGQYARAYGGFGGAPKFPPASAIELLLRRGETEMTSHTLRAMASGGMYDQVGGGFARYSVDPHWLVPHFEKMLYDNALLARAYLHGWQVTGEPLFRTVAEETLDWALREMRGPEGGFFSALDADSEGEEGRFYVWTVEELRAALEGEPDADEAIAWFGATDRGNFEGRNIPVRGPGEPERRDEWRRRLYDVRAQRVWPGLDDKRLTSWNALTIAALADAGAVLERDDYLEAARAAADFVLRELRDSGRRLLRTWKDGTGRLNAYLEDHAFLLEALLSLYEATFEPRWFGEARALADTMIERFGDDEQGGFFETSSDHEQLVARRKDLEDHPIPAGNSSAAYGLLRLSALTGEHRYAERAESVLQLLHELATKHPQAFGHLLQALDFRLARVREVALVGPELGSLERVVRDEFRPHLVLAGGEPDGVPLLAGREPDARDRAARAGGAARLIAALLALMAGAVPAQEPVPVPADAHRVAARISSWGPRPAAGEGEARAHRLIARVFRRAGLRVGIQEFRVPGRGRSRNVIGIRDTPRSCLRIVMAHADSTPNAPGANDNASGLGVVTSLAGRLERIRPWCDVWLVATGAEERVYTGQPDHLGALALARRARSHGARRRLHFALSLDEVGRDRPFWLRSPANAPPEVEGQLLA